MSADHDEPVADEQPLGVGSQRLERALGPLAGIFGLCYAAQTADSAWADRAALSGPLGILLVGLVIASILAATAFSLLQRSFMTVFAIATIAYVVALALWPLALTRPDPQHPMPWLVALWGSYAAYLAVATRRIWIPVVIGALVMADVAIVMMTVDRMAPVDALETAGEIAVLSLILTAVVALVRHVVASAERAQEQALERFAAMRTGQAVERERLRVDNLVNDAVLTTFLSAAAANDPESEALAARMATRGLRVLGQFVEPDREEPEVTLRAALTRSRSSFDPVAGAFDLEFDDLDEVLLPESAAEALAAALIEAMTNSVRHAGDGATRTLRATRDPQGLRIEVRDDGRGFDYEAVFRARRGAKLSIFELLRNAGGHAEFESEVGAGTTVTMLYPLPEVAQVRAPLVTA